MNFGFRLVALSALCLASLTAQAGLFDDEEARKAILDLRTKVESIRQTVDANQATLNARTSEDNASLRKSVLDLQNQIEMLRSDMAKLRGANEQLTRDVSELQRRQKDISQGVDDRLRQFEPTKVNVDGRDFMAEPNEKKEFESALALFRKGDFAESQTLFAEFFKHYPQSGYTPSALFWLGNAQYATRNYKEAISNFRALILKTPDHLRAPEAMLSVSNCQAELKDARGAKRTLEEIVKTYPQSEAAQAAKDRLATRAK